MDRFADDIHFKGGCLLGENFGWGVVMLSYSSRPADPALRPEWRADWLARLEAEPWLAPRWAAMQAKDAYWKHGSISGDYARITVPVLSFGGWADNYMNTVSHLVTHLQVPVKGIVGPWVHQYPHVAVPGPQVGFLQLTLRWWDRWLKGIRNGAEDDPAYRAYMIHSEPPDARAAFREGHWLAEAVWPSARVRREVLSLGCAGPPPGGFTPPGPPVGYLGTDEIGGIEAIVKTPQHLGMQAGEFFPMGLNAEMPGDQRGDDAISTCFEAAVLQSPLDLLGAARLTLRLASDQTLGFVVARLCDVGPDGASVRIAHGMLNLFHRDSMEHPVPMVPGQVVDVAFDLDQMAYRLAAGHRLRLALSTTYWPFVWPSPQAATLTISAGSLDLPVHQGGAVGWVPPPSEGAKSWAHRVLRAGTAARRIETDLLTGRRVLICEDASGEVENLDHGLISGDSLVERWEIDEGDPLSARAHHVWEQTLSRGEWAVRTRAEAEMTATATHLRMAAKLTAWEGNTVVFERSWDDNVERRFV